MPPVNLLIKPASGNCNMRCKYCFYSDVIHNRQTESYGIMSSETLECIVSKVFKYATSECTFAFQGGEPTLVGLDFYRSLIEYVKKYNTCNIKVNYALQTNGYSLDDEWAKFFACNKFLIGLSLDGIKDTHDLYRTDAKGAGTFKKVMNTINLFNKYKVEFNILTVVYSQTAKHIGKIYGFYKKNNLRYQQYIPCLDPLGEKRGEHEYSLTPERYSYFLKTLFDLWYYDIMHGEFIYIRYFENLVGMLIGHAPESCGMLGHCTVQNVIEADGSVYPCDFYVLDGYRIGNLTTDSFETINENRKKSGFIEQSARASGECNKCKWYGLCRGGCRRNREPVENGSLSLNHFCSSYYEFFEYSYERLSQIAKKVIRQNRI